MSGNTHHPGRRWTAALLAALLLPTSAAAATPDAESSITHHRDWHDRGPGWQDEEPERDDRDKDDDHDDDGGGRGRGNGKGDSSDRGWGDGRAGESADWRALAALAANNGGRGFWVLTKSGQLFALDGAPDLGSAATDAPLVAMASHPWLEGLWVLDARGGVHALGATQDHGRPKFTGVGIAASRNGDGYWVVSRRGKVKAFGQAQRHGDARRTGVRVDRIVARDEVDGYYLHTKTDRWLAFPQPPGQGGHRPPGHDDRDEPGRPKPPKPPKPDRPRPTPPEPTTPVVQPPDNAGVTIVNVRGINVAKKIAGNLRRMFAAADRAGMRLGGWGYRSTARQVELRRQHCGTSRYAIYHMPSSQCSPPTARPGHSMHESGQAIDFYKRGKNGQAIQIAGTREFRWLKANAARYGLYNLPSEPWHWSTNGR